jgi:uncharacterized protein YndB with AHSA1/START domain/DNA-binding transcriptional ArsR family regulator
LIYAGKYLHNHPMDSEDQLFRALSSRARRQLLDRLHERNGLTLSQLCGGLAMTRQSATQHLDVLSAANLVTAVRRGRERLHFLNPVPIDELHSRWIHKFERSTLDSLRELKRRAQEEPMHDVPTYVYVTYIDSTPERVWHALTDEELSAAYWGHSNVSDWQRGSQWEHLRTDGSGIADVVGTVLESDPPLRLVLTFDSPREVGAADADPSTVTFDLEPYRDIVRVTVTHAKLRTQRDFDAISTGWPAVLANLKSLLETGHVMAQAPWEMHAEQRAEQMARNEP